MLLYSRGVFGVVRRVCVFFGGQVAEDGGDDGML